MNKRSRFVSEKPIRVNLDDNEWIDVQNGMTYDEFNAIFGDAALQKDAKSPEAKKATLKQIMPFLKAVIKNWNFLDENGEPVQCTPENIDRLDMATVMFIFESIIGFYTPEKKSSEQSETLSSEEEVLVDELESVPSF